MDHGNFCSLNCQNDWFENMAIERLITSED